MDSIYFNNEIKSICNYLENNIIPGKDGNLFQAIQNQKVTPIFLVAKVESEKLEQAYVSAHALRNTLKQGKALPEVSDIERIKRVHVFAIPCFSFTKEGFSLPAKEEAASQTFLLRSFSLEEFKGKWEEEDFNTLWDASNFWPAIYGKGDFQALVAKTQFTYAVHLQKMLPEEARNWFAASAANGDQRATAILPQL